MPTAGCRAPGTICVPEVQLPLPTFNTSVSPMTNHHVCAITDPRKRAILHFPPQSQKLPPPLGIPEPELYGPGFFTSYSYSRGKERTPSLPLEPRQIWASKSLSDTPKKHKPRTTARNSHGFDRKNYNSEDNTFAGTRSLSLKHFLK